MFYISEIYNDEPKCFDTPLQEKTYSVLNKLKIPYSRVKTDEAITMDDCVLINEKLGVDMVKTLFLCNRQKTEFYLYITKGEKQFSSKNLSTALGVSRLSFAPSGLMEQILGTKIGAATIFGILNGSENSIRVVIDKDVTKEEYYGCSDGTTTGYLKLRTKDVLESFCRYVKINPVITEV